MANKFVRSIRGIRNIKKQSLNTNEQNDLLSDTKGNVYVRTLNKYSRITGIEQITDDLDILKEQVELLEPEGEKIKDILKNIQNNIEKIESSDEVTNQTIDSISSDIKDINNEIKLLKELSYDEEIKDLQNQINNLDLTDTTAREDIKYLKKQIEGLKTDIENIEIPNFDDDISNLQNQIDNLDIPTNVNKKITITSWLPINIKNGYEKSNTPDFDPTYCIVDYGSHQEVFIRFGFKNLIESKNVVGDIPIELVPHKMYRNGTTTIAKIPPKIVITTGGNVEIHQYTSDEYIESDYVIYQGSWLIHD